MTVKEFVGTYTVRQGSITQDGKAQLVGVGNTIQIGEGEAAEPHLAPDGTVAVGLAVLEDGTVKTLEDGWPNPMMLDFEDSQLRFLEAETGVGQRQMVVTVLPVGSSYRAIAGNVVVGDPQQAGVWGADDEPDTPGGG